MGIFIIACHLCMQIRTIQTLRFRARQFFYNVFASFNLIIFIADLYTAWLNRHRCSQETVVSLYSVAGLFFTCIFIYFSSRTSLDCSLDHSILNGLLESWSTKRQFQISRRSANKRCKLQYQHLRRCVWKSEQRR